MSDDDAPRYKWTLSPGDTIREYLKSKGIGPTVFQRAKWRRRKLERLQREVRSARAYFDRATRRREPEKVLLEAKAALIEAERKSAAAKGSMDG